MFAKMGIHPTYKGKAWASHPALFLWLARREYFGPALLEYVDIMREEWIRRGYTDNMGPTLEFHRTIIARHAHAFCWKKPVFSSRVYESHIAKLLRKEYSYYYPVFRQNGISIPLDWQTAEYDWTPGEAP